MRSGMNREIERNPSGESRDIVTVTLRCGEHPNVVASAALLGNQTCNLRFDATRSRREAIRDVDDMHGGTVRHNGVMSSTLVFVHAHPDDEALLTAGTMAKAARAGHRVILVIATDGAAGLTSTEFAADLGAVRHRELEESAEILGVDAVHWLGYSDSGLQGEEPNSFASAPLGVIADAIAEIASRADILVGYDPSGGYGHPDHVHVHAAVRAAWPRTQARLFEATLPREPIQRAVRAAAWLRLTPDTFDASEFDRAWTPRAHITNRVDVRSVMMQKQAALRAHASQAHADGTVRTLGILSRLPAPVLNALLGTEYYVNIPRTSAHDVS